MNKHVVRVEISEAIEVEAENESEACEKAFTEIREDGGYECCYTTTVEGSIIENEEEKEEG